MGPSAACSTGPETAQRALPRPRSHSCATACTPACAGEHSAGLAYARGPAATPWRQPQMPGQQGSRHSAERPRGDTAASTPCTGCIGDYTCERLRVAACRKLSAPSIHHPSFFVGLILRGCSLPWPNYGHVVLARPSPILFYPISSTEVGTLHLTQQGTCPFSKRPTFMCTSAWLAPACVLTGRELSPTSTAAGAP